MPETSNYLKHTSRNPLQKFLVNNFYHSLYKLVKHIKPERILDVGCGEGFTLVNLRRNRIGRQHEGIDYSRDAIVLGKKLYPKLNIKLGDIYRLPYRDSEFDLVVCTEVLEHVKDPETALKEIKRVAKKYIALSVPNEPFFMLANLLRGKYLKTFGNHPEHVNHWTAPGFKKFIRHSSLKVSCVKHPFPWTLVLARK